MSTMSKTTYHVHCNGGSIQVSRIGRVELAHNGLRDGGSQSILLTIGPDLDPYLILTTNGDDSAIGLLDDGKVEMCDDVTADWFETFNVPTELSLQDWLTDLVGDLAEGRILDA